jgi:N-acetylneuraminic acid mutarotase
MCFHIIDTPGIGRRVYLVGGLGTKDLDIYNPFNRTWSKGKPVPITLHHVQCVVTQGKLWLVAAWMGGYPQEKNVNATYVYDPATNSWATKSALPVERRRGSAAAMLSPDGTKIYVSHGTTGGHETFATSLPYLDEYEIATDTWTALSSNAPNPRDHTGGAMVNGLICVAGGRNGGEINWPMVAPTDCFNLTSKQWKSKIQCP